MAALDQVIQNNLCTGCGVCLAVCGHDALAMKPTPTGTLEPLLNLDNCTECGLCDMVCSGIALRAPWPGIENPFEGDIIEAVLVRAADPGWLKDGQSGGAVTAILAALLSTGAIDAALVTAAGENGSLDPKPQWVNDVAALRRAAGSNYAPVAPMSIWSERPEGKLAVTGVSCHIHGLWNLSKLVKKRTKDVALTIGLFCDRTMTYGAQDLMLEQLGLTRETTARLQYRSKHRRGWPGEVCATDVDGQQRWGSADVRIICKDLCTPPRCRLCFDKFNAFADLSVGDAHGYGDRSADWTVTLVRTERGKAALERAVESGWVVTAPANIRQTLDGQRQDLRISSYAAHAHARQRKGRPTPDYGFELPPAPPESAINAADAEFERLKFAHLAGVTRESVLADLRKRLRSAKLKRQLLFWVGLPIRVVRRAKRALRRT